MKNGDLKSVGDQNQELGDRTSIKNLISGTSHICYMLAKQNIPRHKVGMQK